MKTLHAFKRHCSWTLIVTNQRRLNGKEGNIKNTNLLSNKVERFEFHADYFRDSVEQNHCSGYKIFLPSQTIPRKPKVHYLSHMSPILDTTLILFNPVHDFAKMFCRIRFSIIIPCKPMSTKWHVSATYSDKHMVMHFSSPKCLVILHIQVMSVSTRIWISKFCNFLHLGFTYCPVVQTFSPALCSRSY